MKLPTYFVILFLCSWSLIAQDTTATRIEKRKYITKPLSVSTPIKIDGLITESGWDTVAWTGDFIEREPDENTPPTYQTKFKITYDQNYLYVAYRCYDDEPSKIAKRLSRRDGFTGDRITLILDTYHDKRTAFSFTISAAGVKGDEFVSRNGYNWDSSWNPIWYAASNIDDEGWTSEIKIPLSQLKFGKSKEQLWGIQVNRLIFRKAERSVWQRIPRDAPGLISEIGELHGLINIEPQNQLEIQPFAVAQFDTYEKEQGNPFRTGRDYKLNGGLDAKIGITNDLTLDLTINPDFGQVEADPAALALDGFQLFFREQRPFFVENKNIFDYQFAEGSDNIFYSRRIGRNPQGSISDIDGEFVDKPNNTTILGAAKFSGKTKNGWSIGFLESVTSTEVAKIEDEAGNKREAIVEPLTNYMVGRLQKDFNNRNSFIGGIFTATNRNLGDIFEIDEEDPATDETIEIAGTKENNLNLLHKAAYTGGVDFRHSWKDRKYFVYGSIVGSRVEGSKEAIEETQNSLTHLFQRSDASHVFVDPNRTSLSGTGGKFLGGKSGGGNWRYRAGVLWRSPGLELNDIGFLRQADDIRQFLNVQYMSLKPTELYRKVEVNFDQFTTYDFEGNYNRIQYQLKGFINYKNNWWTDISFAHKPRIFTNTFLRGGPRWRFSNENFAFLYFGSDDSKKFSFTAGYNISRAQEKNFAFNQYVLRFQYQPLDALSLSINPRLRTNTNKTQYVTEEDYNGVTRYITANIDRQTLSTSIRLNYNINPNLTIQYYGEPYISRGRYSDFNYVNDPIAKALSKRVTWYNQNQVSFADDTYSIDENNDGTVDYTFDNPDFSYVQFRSNLVLRWEYIPGSELFFVWRQGVTEDGTPGDHLFRNLDNHIIKQRLENTFLIKATYRFIL